MNVSHERRDINDHRGGDQRRDLEQLRLLAIFHYVVGGLMIAFASVFIFHFVFAVLIATDPELFRNGKTPFFFPPAVGYLLAGFVGTMIVAGWTLGALTVYSGRCLATRTRWLFSLVIAGLSCMWTPFGTVLGVFTIVVLNRESVRRLYGEES